MSSPYFQEQPHHLTSLVGYLFDLQKSAEELLVSFKDPQEDSQRHVCASNEKETSKPCIAKPSRQRGSSAGQESELFLSVVHLQLTQLANFKQQGAQGASSRRPKQVRWSDVVASHTNSDGASKCSSVRTSLALKHAEAAADTLSHTKAHHEPLHGHSCEQSMQLQEALSNLKAKHHNNRVSSRMR